MRAFYDLAIAAPTFVFQYFAMMAKHAGCDEVVIVPGVRMLRARNGSLIAEMRYSADDYEKRINTIIIPLAKSFGLSIYRASSREEAASLWSENRFPPRYTAERPSKFPGLKYIVSLMPGLPYPKADPALVRQMRERHGHPIVITLREETINPARNSNLPEWQKAAEIFQRMGYSVVFVPDTKNAKLDIGFPSCAEAAFDVGMRLALMDVALMNMFVPNGPATLCILSDRPMLQFKTLNPECVETSAQYWEAMGLPVGTQPHWFNSRQRFVWADDTRDVIVSAFNEIFPLKEAA